MAASNNFGDSPVWGYFLITIQGGYHSDLDDYANAAHVLNNITRGFDIYESPGQAGLRLELETSDIPESSVLQVGSFIQVDTKHMDPATRRPRVGLNRSFTGTVLVSDRTGSGDDRRKETTCYDMLSLLARTDNTLVYSHKRADEIFTDIARGYGFGIAGVANTQADIGRLVQGTGQSVWSLLEEALQRTTDKTGRRFIIRAGAANFDQLELVEVGNTGSTWTVNNAVLTDFRFSDDAQNLRAEVNVVTEIEDEDEDGEPIEDTSRNVVTTTVRKGDDSPEVRTFGLLRRTIGPDGADSTAAENTARANQELAALARIEQRMTTDLLLIPGIRRGDAVVIDSPNITHKTTWHVDAVRSSYQPGSLSQSLDLVFAAKDVSL